MFFMLVVVVGVVVLIGLKAGGVVKKAKLIPVPKIPVCSSLQLRSLQCPYVYFISALLPFRLLCSESWFRSGHQPDIITHRAGCRDCPLPTAVEPFHPYMTQQSSHRDSTSHIKLFTQLELIMHGCPPDPQQVLCFLLLRRGSLFQT